MIVIFTADVELSLLNKLTISVQLICYVLPVFKLTLDAVTHGTLAGRQNVFLYLKHTASLSKVISAHGLNVHHYTDD